MEVNETLTSSKEGIIKHIMTHKVTHIIEHKVIHIKAYKQYTNVRGSPLPGVTSTKSANLLLDYFSKGLQSAIH